MISKLFSFFSFDGKQQTVATEADTVSQHENMKVLLITCVDSCLEVEDRVALYLKACIKMYEWKIKGVREIEENWDEFLSKFIVAKACEFKVLKAVRIKAQEIGYGVYQARLKKDSNPKNVVLAIGLVAEKDIDDLLYD